MDRCVLLQVTLKKKNPKKSCSWETQVNNMHCLQAGGEGPTPGATVVAGGCCVDLETSASGRCSVAVRDLCSSGVLKPACYTTLTWDFYLICLWVTYS